jgi:hypothetical protein
MDVSDASYYIQTMKITKIKVAKWGTPKKIFKKEPNHSFLEVSLSVSPS